MNEIMPYLKDGDHLPVFPLPEFVLFPGVVAPLHIFEPRYRQLLEHILDRKGVFCMATLRDGRRGRHAGTPEFWGLGCACRLLEYERLVDGRYNILIEGLVRVRMKEIASQQLYRRVSVSMVPPVTQPPVPAAREERIRQFVKRLMEAMPGAPAELEDKLSRVELSALLNLMAFHCPVTVEDKLKLLYAPNDLQFCDRLIKLYETVEF